MNLFEMTAYAQEAAGAVKPGPNMVEMLVMPLGLLVIMYFLMIRPQQKKARDQESMIQGLKPGDEVVTTGGIFGRVRSLQETTVSLEVSPGTQIKINKANISMMASKVATLPEKSAEKPAKA